jgi:hypothetical protein
MALPTVERKARFGHLFHDPGFLRRGPRPGQPLAQIARQFELAVQIDMQMQRVRLLQRAPGQLPVPEWRGFRIAGMSHGARGHTPIPKTFSNVLGGRLRHWKTSKTGIVATSSANQTCFFETGGAFSRTKTSQADIEAGPSDKAWDSNRTLGATPPYTIEILMV